MIRMVDLSHKVLATHPHPLLGVDMTCGNGRDTLFLARKCERVYAFDIQELAIKNTTKLLEENQISNVIVVHKSHDLFDEVIKDQIDLAIYNLGYLPGSDKTIKTDSKTVLRSLMKLIKAMAHGGIIVIVVYLHDRSESMAIEEFLKNLPEEFDVIRHEILNRTESPYLLEITRK